jgi:multiple sugar transport system permease protein
MPSGPAALRIRTLLVKAGVGLACLLLLIWTLLPLYHMLILSLTPVGAGFAGRLWPDKLTFDNYRTVLTQDDHYLDMFWRQMGNSLFVAFAACLMVLVCGLMAGFAIARLRPRFGPTASRLALVSYFVPATFLAIPFYQVMISYHLIGSQWALILAVVTFATPYAIWVLQENSGTIPHELDEAARIDGATPLQLFRLVYVPLMVPTIVAVGAFALMLAWNEYLYAFLLMSDASKITMPVVMGQFLNDDSPPWPLLMATGILYSLPPAALFLVARQFMRTGLLSGGVKG